MNPSFSTYRCGLGTRLLRTGGLGVLLTGPPVILALSYGSYLANAWRQAGDPRATWVLVPQVLLGLVFLAWLARLWSWGTVVLTAEAVQYRGLFWSERLPRAELSEVRLESKSGVVTDEVGSLITQSVPGIRLRTREGGSLWIPTLDLSPSDASRLFAELQRTRPS